MADANGIIFKNPTLNTWFVGPSVDLTAWNVITVSGSSVSAINGNYTYVSSNNRWENGDAIIKKVSTSYFEGESEKITYRWLLSYGELLFYGSDNGLNVPPSSLGSVAYPRYITVSEGVPSGLNGTYTFSYNTGEYGMPVWWLTENYLDGQIFALSDGYTIHGWIISYFPNFPTVYYTLYAPLTDDPVSKTGWNFTHGSGTVPSVSYDMTDIVGSGDTLSLSCSSTVTWASASPTSGFVSLTDTPDEDFGYVITLDVQGGASYPYYKYCTKMAGEVYGTLPEASRENYIFAGWYTEPEGQGTRVAATDELVAAEDHTLYAKWVKRVSGKVGCGACLVSLFALGIGTDIFCEYIGSRLAKTTPQTIVRKIPKP